MRPLLALALFGLMHMPLTSFGQQAFGGEPYGPRTNRHLLPAAPLETMPYVDNAALLTEDAVLEAHGQKGWARFGEKHTTYFSLANSGLWTTLPGGVRVWRLSVHCPAALGIGITFSEYVIPHGARLFLYNRSGTVLGGYTAQSNPGHTVLGVQPLPGDIITIEYVEPANVAGSGALTVGEVIHVYRADNPALGRDFGDSGDCNVNVICPDGDAWRPEIRSVACILAGGGYCTGTLLNNCANDSIPYFLTANHCLAGGDPSTWVFRFNWDSPVCEPTENAPTDQTVSGSTQLAANPGSDMLFLQLNSQPPPEFDVYYAGWDASGNVPDSGTCIHHPRGDIKKISHDHQPQGVTNGIDVGNGPADCWHVFNWDSGTTEPGSSGSALWDQDHRIIGQLYGGSAMCGNNVDDYFGRFDVSYPFIEQWLGACDSLDGLDPGYTEPGIVQNAAITSIGNVPPLLCNEDSIHPMVTLKNNGLVELGTVTIEFGIIGGASSSITWSGSLLPLQTANVQLPWIAVLNGQQQMVAHSLSPNGLNDQDQTDDADTLEFVASSPGELVTLEIQPDNYGQDITWDLANEFGTQLYSGGPYTNSNTSPIIREFCLGDGCYIFTINDEFEDGICCTEGDGHYTITSAFGTHVESNGDYGAGEVREFCIAGVGIQPISVSGGLHVWPNPVSSTLQLSIDLPEKSDMSWSLSDLTGRIVLSGSAPHALNATINVSTMSPGTYVLRAVAGHQVFSTKVAVRR